MTQVVTDLSDAQVLSQLKKRRVRLLLEVDRVTMAIKAFSNVKQEEINALESLAYDQDLEIDIIEEVENELKPMIRYDPDMSYPQKVFWALTKMNGSTAMEITDLLMHQDKELKHRTKLLGSITYAASKMFKLGKIDATKKEGVNYYRLRES
jgi:hypothetical protein